MPIRNIQTVEPQNFGAFEPITGCKGPFSSLEKGRDSITCAKCFHIRNMAIKENVIFYSGNLIDHIDNILKRYTFIKFSKSTCGIASFAYNKTELCIEDVEREDAMDFFRFRRDEMVGDFEILPTQIYNNVFSTPIIFPSNETRRYSVYGGNEGVSIKEGILTVTDRKKAFESGKYVYIINYYQFLDILSGTKHEMKIF